MSEGQVPPPSVRVYTALFKAYPKQFRCEYGSQMQQLFWDVYWERRGSRSGLVLLWIRTLSDLVPTAVAQRIVSHTNRREVVCRIAGRLLSASCYFSPPCTSFRRRF